MKANVVKAVLEAYKTVSLLYAMVEEVYSPLVLEAYKTVSLLYTVECVAMEMGGLRSLQNCKPALPWNLSSTQECRSLRSLQNCKPALPELCQNKFGVGVLEAYKTVSLLYYVRGTSVQQRVLEAYKTVSLLYRDYYC